ncbi:MAG TPA: nucleotidyltransferase [Acidobacteriota bacterium]|nr:nucleotidyltransferase [Acidobacteriota bacterium]
MASTLDLLKRLNDHRAKYVLVGGMACVIHGSQIVTQDVDVCAPLTQENLPRLLAALAGIHARFRMTPDLHPLPDDPEKLEGFKNLYLVTNLGQLDVLSEITGVGEYSEVEQHTILVDLEDIQCRVLDLDTLITAKKAMNSPKDRQTVIELEAIRERLRGLEKR